MKINDSTYSNQALQTVKGAQGIDKTNQQANVKSVVAVDENNVNKANQNSEQNKPRFEVSEKAIALLEEQAGQKSAQSGSALAKFEGAFENGKASESNQQKQSAQYDQPSQQNLSAVAAYQSVGNIAQRENIKQFFGVNLFA